MSRGLANILNKVILPLKSLTFLSALVYVKSVLNKGGEK